MSASTDDITRIERYVKQLGDVDARVQDRATDNLATSDSSLVLPLVTSLLKDDNPNKRRNAARVLSTIGNRKSVRPLVEALSDERADVRFWVCGALGVLGNIDAIPKLTEVAGRDGSKKVKKAAKKAIEDIRMSQSSNNIKRQINDEVFIKKAEEIQERMRSLTNSWKKDKPHTKKAKSRVTRKRRTH